MSDAAAIAAVTDALRELIRGALQDQLSGENPEVTIGPPDRAASRTTHVVNLYLYLVSPNAALRNHVLPGLPVKDGQTAPPQLALDLHYLLTAYPKDEDHGIDGQELLGLAMRALHEAPILNKTRITHNGFEYPFEELVRVTPQALSLDEMSKLWSAFQTPYRLSAAYQVSVVIITRLKAAKAVLPVLRRGAANRGAEVQGSLIPPLPTLVDIKPSTPPKGFRPDESPPRFKPNETLIVSGYHLDQLESLELKHSNRAVQQIVVPPMNASAEQVQIRLNDPNLAAGLYRLTGYYRKPADYEPRVTNQLMLLVQPHVSSVDPIGADNRFLIQFAPQVVPGQRIRVVVGETECKVGPLDQRTSQLEFNMPKLPHGEYPVRLQVDGLHSRPDVEEGDGFLHFKPTVPRP